MATISKIKKLAAGKVQFLDSSNNVIASLLPVATIKSNGLGGLLLADATQTRVIIYAQNITELIIDPNPATPFSGNAQALWGELVADFFRG